MKKPDHVTCASCVYFYEDKTKIFDGEIGDDVTYDGACVRYPPTKHATAETKICDDTDWVVGSQLWVNTNRQDFCGEHPYFEAMRRGEKPE